jgi:AraC-like DNA-binding protein
MNNQQSVTVPRRILSSLLSSLAAGVVPRAGAPYIAIGRKDEIGAFLNDLETIGDGGSSMRFLIGRYGSGKSFLIQLMRTQTQRADADSVFLRREELDSHLANRIKEILSERLHTSLSIDELAGMLNYNKSYLFRQFKASTGHTIMSYFTAMKIEEAKRLLRKSDLSVAQISASLAFDTPNYFSKTFKRLTGTRPSDYRRIHTAKPK